MADRTAAPPLFLCKHLAVSEIVFIFAAVISKYWQDYGNNND